MATPTPSRSQRPKFSEIGATGLRIWGGRVYEEWLPELIGERGRRVIREMAEQDPTVGGILFAIENLVRQTQWTFAPRDDSEQAVEIADFAQQCLDDMQPHWPDTVSEILSMLPYGWSWFEIVYKYRNGPQDDPAATSHWEDGKIGWKTWGIRGQESLLRWETDEHDHVTAMVQNPPPRYQTLTIPLKKSLHFRTKSRKDNPEGVSVLRSAYRPWYFKKHIEQIEGIGVERDLAGLPVMWVPPELLSPNASDEQKMLLQELQKIVTNIRRDEQEGVIMPLAYDETGKEAYKLQLISTGGQRQFDTDKIIQRYDQRIAMTLLADFILLGHEQVGSFALADSKTALFATALGAWLDSIATTINRFEMPRLLKLNGYDPKLVPTLSHSDIENADLGKLGTYLQSLASAGMTLFPNPTMEKHLLEQAGIPVPEEMPSQTEAMVQQQLQEMGLVDQLGNPISQEEPPPPEGGGSPSSNGKSPETLRQKNRTSAQGAAEQAGTPMRTPKSFAASEYPETEEFFNPFHAKRTGRFDFNPMGTAQIVGGSLVKQFGGQAAAIRELHNRGKRPAEIARLLGVRPQAVHGQIAKVKKAAAVAQVMAPLNKAAALPPAKGGATSHGGPAKPITPLRTPGGHQEGHSRRKSAVAMGLQQPGPARVSPSKQHQADIKKVDLADVRNVRRMARGDRPLADTPSVAAARARVGPSHPGGQPGTSHGGKAVGWKNPEARGLGSVQPREVIHHGPGHTVRAGGAAKGEKIGPGMGQAQKLGAEGVAKLQGQHLKDRGIVTERGSTGDVQRVRKFETSHGGSVRVAQDSVGRPAGVGVRHATAHKGPVVTPAAAKPAAPKGEGQATKDRRAVINRQAQTATLKRVAGRAEQLETRVPGQGQTAENRARAARNQQKIDARAAADRRLARKAVAAKQAAGNVQRDAEAMAMGKHIEVVDAVGAGRLQGPITDIKFIGGGINGAYSGRLGGPQGPKVAIKPVREAFDQKGVGAVRGNITPGNDHGREAAAPIVARAMGVNAPHVIIRDVPGKGPAVVMEWKDGQQARIAGGHAHVAKDSNLGLYDAVIGNTDRHGGNYLINKGQVVAIDHGLAFPDKARGGGGGNRDWQYAHGGKSLTPAQSSMLRKMRSDAKLHADIEPLVGKEAVRLMDLRIDHMIKTGKILRPHEEEQAYGHAARVPAVAPLPARHIRQGGLGGFTSHGGVGGKGRGVHGKGHWADRNKARAVRLHGAPAAGGRHGVRSAAMHVAQFGVAARFKAMGIGTHQQPRVNKRGRVGWWIAKPGGGWQWVDFAK